MHGIEQNAKSRFVHMQIDVQVVGSFAEDHTDPPAKAAYDISHGAAGYALPADGMAPPRRWARDPTVPARPAFVNTFYCQP